MPGESTRAGGRERPRIRKPSVRTRAAEEGRGAASPNLEQYVETIAHLLTKDKVCTVSEIAEVAQVTRPAASRAVRELASRELAVHKAYGYVDLTADGHRLAARLTARHDILHRFLRDVLGYAENEADAEACRLEHQVDDALARRLDLLTELVGASPAMRQRLSAGLAELEDG